MAKDYRTLMYQRVLGPIVRLTRSLEEAIEAARRSTDDPADLAWEERVWRLEVLAPDEEIQYTDRLRKWLDVLEKHLESREYLVDGRFTQAEVSVYPRVAMYPFIRIPIRAERYPNVIRWMAQLGKRPSFSRTLSEQDRALLALSRTPILEWLGNTLKKPAVERRAWERAALPMARKAFLRATAPSKSSSDAEASNPKAIRKPVNGTIPPTSVMVRSDDDTVVAASEDSSIALYGYHHSPHTQRVRVFLDSIGLPWRFVEVDMARMEHKSSRFLSMNPNGELPVLVHGERVLYDSQVIAEYLHHTFAEATREALYPADAHLRAQTRMWLALEAGTHKEFRPLFYKYIIRRELKSRGVSPQDVGAIVADGVHTSYRQWLQDTVAGTLRFDTSEELATEIILKKLTALETRLCRESFLVGDSPTMADLAWLTRIRTFASIGLSLQQAHFPSILRWLGDVTQRWPSASAAWT